MTTDGSHHINFAVGAIIATGAVAVSRSVQFLCGSRAGPHPYAPMPRRAGGLMGYAKARSVPSLVAGLSFGTLYAAAGYLIASGRERNGHDLAVGVSALLVGAMGARIAKTRKVR